MRTTLNLDADVLDRARKAASRARMPFCVVVNEALRAGLDQIEHRLTSRPYATVPHRMGLRDGFALDNVQEVLSRIEGEDTR